METIKEYQLELRDKLMVAVFSPIGLFLLVYVFYFWLIYSGIHLFAFWSLLNLGTRIAGFKPSVYTILVYAYGMMVFIAGCLAGNRAYKRLYGKSSNSSSMIYHFIDSVVKYDRNKLGNMGKIIFLAALAGYMVSLLANIVQIVVLGSLSLFSIASRWQQSPMLVWFATLQTFFLPALLVIVKKRWRWFVHGAFLVSLFASSLLGARNIPAKIVVAYFVAIAFISRPKHLWKVVAGLLIILILVLGMVGALSKSGIYGPTATAELALGLLYSDSVGTVFNFERILDFSSINGNFRGKLLSDSALALIPGVSAEYANYQLGKLLQGRSYLVIGGEKIERSISLAPSLLGAAYADFGMSGVFVQMLLIGFLFGYFQTAAKEKILYLPFLAILAAYVINGVNAGIHNPHAILITGLVVVLLLFDLCVGLLGRKGSNGKQAIES